MPSTAVGVPAETGRQEPRLITRLTRHGDLNDTIQEYDRTADRYDEVRMKREGVSGTYVLYYRYGKTSTRWFKVLAQCTLLIFGFYSFVLDDVHNSHTLFRVILPYWLLKSVDNESKPTIFPKIFTLSNLQALRLATQCFMLCALFWCIADTSWQYHEVGIRMHQPHRNALMVSRDSMIIMPSCLIWVFCENCLTVNQGNYPALLNPLAHVPLQYIINRNV